MTEPNPGEQYDVVQPAGESIDPMDELVLWEVLSDEALKMVDETVSTTTPRITPPHWPAAPWPLNPGTVTHIGSEEMLERIRKLEMRVDELEAKTR